MCILKYPACSKSLLKPVVLVITLMTRQSKSRHSVTQVKFSFSYSWEQAQISWVIKCSQSPSRAEHQEAGTGLGCYSTDHQYLLSYLSPAGISPAAGTQCISTWTQRCTSRAVTTTAHCADGPKPKTELR